MLAPFASVENDFSSFFSHVTEYITVTILLSSKIYLDLVCTL